MTWGLEDFSGRRLAMGESHITTPCSTPARVACVMHFGPGVRFFPHFFLLYCPSIHLFTFLGASSGSWRFGEGLVVGYCSVLVGMPVGFRYVCVRVCVCVCVCLGV